MKEENKFNKEIANAFLPYHREGVRLDNKFTASQSYLMSNLRAQCEMLQDTANASCVMDDRVELSLSTVSRLMGGLIMQIDAIQVVNDHISTQLFDSVRSNKAR